MNPASRLAGTPWMIREDAFRTLAIRAAMAASGHAPPTRVRPRLSAAESRARRPDRAESGVAVLDVIGPIYRHSSPLDDCLAELFGGVSVDAIRAGLRAALADPQVRGIALNIDSPGGEAAGIGELAAEIRAAAGVKPVIAHAEAAMCSAAYHLGAAAGEVVVGADALVGSIGVVFVAVDDRDFQEKVGIKEIPIVSSQSPAKWADPATEAGRATYQDLVDTLGANFIASVAHLRGTTAERVRSDFGRGGLLVGAAAVKAGMADRVGTLDEVVRKLSGPNRARLAASRPAALAPAATTTQGPPGRRIRLRLRPASLGRA